MRWPRLTRRKGAEGTRVEPREDFAPGSWGQAATPYLPPPVPEPAVAPTGNVEVISPIRSAPPSAPTSQQAPQSLVAAPNAAVSAGGIDPARGDEPPAVPGKVEPNSGVRLGFADGSDLELDPDHPHSLALKAVADVLLHRNTHRRHSRD